MLLPGAFPDQLTHDIDFTDDQKKHCSSISPLFHEGSWLIFPLLSYSLSPIIQLSCHKYCFHVYIPLFTHVSYFSKSRSYKRILNLIFNYPKELLPGNLESIFLQELFINIRYLFQSIILTKREIKQKRKQKSKHILV